MERKLIAAAVSSALALPMAAQAVEFSVSGHVNRALVSLDGGTKKNEKDGTITFVENDGKVQHVDANVSESRVRFVGSEELDNGVTVGVNLELGLGGQAYSYSGDDLRVRHQNVYVMTQGGKITLGQTQTTSDNVPYANAGGPSFLAGVTNWCPYGGGYDDPRGSPGCQSNSNGRKELLRYDSPSFGPVTIAGSVGEGDYWDTMLKIADSAGDTSYDIRLGYVGDNDSDGDDMVTVAGSIGFAQGTTVTAAWGKDNEKTLTFEEGTLVDGMPLAKDEKVKVEADYQYLAVDQSYGDGSIGAYYGTGEIGGVDGSRWGIGVGHNLGGGASAYAGFRNTERDGSEDATHIIVGMRVTFN